MSANSARLDDTLIDLASTNSMTSVISNLQLTSLCSLQWPPALGEGPAEVRRLLQLIFGRTEHYDHPNNGLAP